MGQKDIFGKLYANNWAKICVYGISIIISAKPKIKEECQEVRVYKARLYGDEVRQQIIQNGNCISQQSNSRIPQLGIQTHQCNKSGNLHFSLNDLFFLYNLRGQSLIFLE